ncbi:MAG: PD-(D/E)XK nuclease family protein [Eubacteriales bacterium]|nr:PD-(D/E)XK nuclease family protein [Eubacteriales bacterium]
MGRYNFITGPAGAGKSTFIYETLTEQAVREPGKRFYLFVPEQNTLKAQQEIIRRSKRHGMLNLDVLSFTLLSYRVFEELGIRKPQVLDDVTKSVLLRKTLGEVKNELLVYKNKINSPGFISQLKSLISEFSQYEVKPESLKQYAEKADEDLLKGKLNDIALITGRFFDNLHLNEGNAIPEEIPELLIKYLSKSGLLDDAVIYFDGYTGFTPVQLDIIERILPKAAECHFAVTIERNEKSRKNGHFTDLFAFSRETINLVTDTASRAGVLKDDDIELDEANPHGSFKKSRNPVNEAKIYYAPDPVSEVRFLAADIREKAVSGRARYRDMAVILSDIAGYKEIVKREFKVQSIPLFIDDKEPATSSPVIEYVRSALNVIKESYEYEDVITFLRNEYVTGRESREILDIFDNYLRETAINGKGKYHEDWSEYEWIPKGYDINILEDFKKEKFDGIFKLHEGLLSGALMKDKCEALKEFLVNGMEAVDEATKYAGEDTREDGGRDTGEEKEKTKREDKEEAEKFAGEETGDGTSEKIMGKTIGEAVFEEHPEDRRFVNLTLSFLESISTLLGSEKVSIAEFTDIIEAGLMEMKAGNIPATLDMVTAGDLRRSRFDNIKYLYVVGANEGKIPATVTGGGLFTDNERQALLCAGLKMAPDDIHDTAIQNFYLYLFMNKPSEELIITYPITDRDGRSIKPAVILKDRLKSEPGKRGEKLPELIPTTLESALNLLSNTILNEGNDSKKAAVIAEVIDSARCGEIIESSKLVHTDEKLSAESALGIYGETLNGSVSRLEEFERCPMRHFLRYGLSLRERRSYGLERVDIGNLYHSSLDKFFKKLKSDSKDIKKLSKEELELFIMKAVDEAAGDYRGNVFNDSAKNKFVRNTVERTLKRTVFTLSDQLKAGDYAVIDTERKYVVSEPHLELHGTIDRIDESLTDDESGIFVSVIDYKTRKTEIDLTKIANGISMQLPTYLKEAMAIAGVKGKRVIPAGMYYYHVDDPVLDVTEASAGEEAIMDKLTLNGLTLNDSEALRHIDHMLMDKGVKSKVTGLKIANNGRITGGKIACEEEFYGMLENTRQIMRDDAGRILNGEIRVHPYEYKQESGCDYCPYSAVCRIDRKIPGFKKRRISDYKSDED